MKRIHLSKKMTFLPALPFAALFHSTLFSPAWHLQILMPRDKVLGIVTTEIKKSRTCAKSERAKRNKWHSNIFLLFDWFAYMQRLFYFKWQSIPLNAIWMWVVWWARTNNRTSYFNFTMVEHLTHGVSWEPHEKRTT